MRLDFDLARSYEAFDKSKMLLEELTVLAARKRVHSWTMPGVLVPVPTFLVPIKHLSWIVYRDATLLQKGGHLLYLNGLISSAEVSTARSWKQFRC